MRGMAKPYACFVAVLLLVGCATSQRSLIESGEGSSDPSSGMPKTVESAPTASPDVGYLQVSVRSGAPGQNPPVPEAEIEVREMGIEVATDADGNSPSIELPAPEPHPVVQSAHIGYYTVIVTKPGFKRHIHHTFVHGGSTGSNPTTVAVYLIPGEGEHVVSDSPVGGRSAPQTQGPGK